MTETRTAEHIRILLKPNQNRPTLAFLAAFSALTWLGVFLAGVLAPPLLETDLASSVSAATVSEVTLRALFILSTFGVAAEERKR